MLKRFRSYTISISLTAFLACTACAGEAPLRERNIQPLAVGAALPHFTLTDVQHNPVEIYDILDDEPVVLIYYRGGW